MSQIGVHPERSFPRYADEAFETWFHRERIIAARFRCQVLAQWTGRDIPRHLGQLQ